MPTVSHMITRAYDLDGRRQATAGVMAAVEQMVKVRAAPAASFDELDQAIDGCREAFEAWQRAVAPVSHNTPIAVDMRLAPTAIT